MITKSILHKHMEALQKTYKPRPTVGASETGQCARKVWYTKHTPFAKALEESYGASHRGNMIENHTVVPALRRHFGANILYSGKDQRTLVSGDISCTPDGLLINLPKDFLSEFGVKDVGEDRCVLIEIKSIDPRIQLRGPKPEHERQVIQQLGIVREKTEHQPEYCLLMYINASFMDDVTEFVVAYDERRYQLQKERAKRILSSTSAREMQPEGWIKGGKECETCGFHRPCVELRTDIPPANSNKATPQFVAEIKELAKQERDLDATASGLKEKQHEIQLQIRDRLREKHLRGIKESDIVVTWYPVKGRVTFDNDALRAAAELANFSLTPFERVGDPSDGLRITLKDTVPTATGGKTGKSKVK